MIIIDIFSNIYSCILFFPFLSYLIKKKRHITYYVMYGLLFDITLLNHYFTSTIIMLLAYYLYPKKSKNLFRFYILIYNVFIASNLLALNNLYFMVTPSYIISLVINIMFYLNSHKNYIF